MPKKSKAKYRRKPGRQRSHSHAEPPARIAKVLIIVPLDVERDYLFDVVESRDSWSVNSRRKEFDCTFNGSVGPVEVTVSTLSGMGHVNAVVGSTAALSGAGPDMALMVGIAGSLDKENVALADVVVSNQVKYYSSDKVFEVSGEYEFGATPPARSKNEIVVDERDRLLKQSALRYERDVLELDSMNKVLTEFESSVRKNEVNLESFSADGIFPAKFEEQYQGFDRDRKIHMGWILGSNQVVVCAVRA